MEFIRAMLISLLLSLTISLVAGEIKKGSVCEPRSFSQPFESDRSKYWQCTPISDSNPNVGEWAVVSCPSGRHFVPLNQTCVVYKNIRRQQTSCSNPNYYGSCGQPACTASNQNPSLGTSCNWQSASLTPASSNANFLQCNPQYIGSSCGNWQQMSCSPGTQFNPQLQVCVSTALQGSCPYQQQVAVCGCQQQSACPSSCSCQQNSCCQQMQLPMCPAGSQAISMCTTSTQCPPGYACSGGGCCPIVCPDGRYAIQGCDPNLPSTCPKGFFCDVTKSGCCLEQLIICPSGQSSISHCTDISLCPAGYTCQNGGCCPQPLPNCPNGQPATQTCTGTGQSNCPTGLTCQNGGCCTQPIPTCPNGQPALSACSSTAPCPQGFTCQNNGCCPQPLPNCPNGQVALSQCSTPANCPQGFTCQNGGCCLSSNPLSQTPICPSGQSSLYQCPGSGQSNCPQGYLCLNGGCCSQPPTSLCPNGQPPISNFVCSGTGQSSCPQGFTCQNGGCCVQPLPNCPNGQVATAACSGSGQSTCQTGFTCLNGGCCLQPMPICPTTGQAAMGLCGGPGQTCPSNLVCTNGGCCPLPPCQGGAMPVQVCGANNQCPAGFSCQGQGCCPIPLPPCPNGQLSTQLCTGTGQANCPNGYYCANGGCCRLPNCIQGGQPAVQICTPGSANTCPAGLQCESPTNACCPVPLPMCPNNQLATTPCNGPGTCPNNYYCFNRGCCLIPVCPDTSLAIQPCDANTPCPQNFQCTNGGCCAIPMPKCPNGIPATTRCAAATDCPPNFLCQNGGCCPAPPPQCPNGQPSSAWCNQPGQVCTAGTFCVGGGCCPLACRGVQPSQACINNVCPPNFQCLGGACCPIPFPMCPNNIQSTQLCQGTGASNCPPGFYCTGGGCCRLPSCPNGQNAVEACSAANTCSSSALQCVGPSCCPVPQCPTGGQPVQQCGVGNTCPAGYSCVQNTGCCPMPLPMCPTGQPAIQTCAANGVCPPGYQCINGGCCFVQQQQPCPQPQVPVCYCAQYNNACPQQSSCSTGTCCAQNIGASVSVYAAASPGNQCGTGQDCRGYPLNSACINSYCSCVNGARSDGVTCTSRRLQYSSKNSCTQFGTPCSKVGTPGQRRRRPTGEELGIDNSTLPQYWIPLQVNTVCRTDNDCIPEMFCLNKVCAARIRPGEYMCKSSEQCVSDCPSKDTDCGKAVCIAEPNTNTTICACEEGFRINDGGCWKKCPVGTKDTGKSCVPAKVQKSSPTSFAKRLISFFNLDPSN